MFIFKKELYYEGCKLPERCPGKDQTVSVNTVHPSLEKPFIGTVTRLSNSQYCFCNADMRNLELKWPLCNYNEFLLVYMLQIILSVLNK
jgi:hypothetical protein